MIEILHRYLCDANMSNVPVYFVSSFANQSLAYSNIFAEWLCDSKQSLAYAAEYPFQHGDLVKTNFLKVNNFIYVSKQINDKLLLFFEYKLNLKITLFFELFESSKCITFIKLL